MIEPGTTSQPADASLAELVERLGERLQAGGDPEVFLADHPTHAPALCAFLPSLRALADLAGPAPAQPATATLGDYRIVREVGRGGMGIVYEAVQESLKRRVALKVLPPESAGGSQRLQRFRREAEAVARLHHTNIVAVHGVGECAGTHYLAMQFIDGVGLDVVVRTLAGAARNTPPPGTSARTWELIGGLRTGRFVRPSAETDPAAGAVDGVAGLPPVSYFRTVAGLVAQAADALHHAHQHGVLHRDVKPSNLLLDETGTLWVADFGLARIEDGDALTESGDLVGTLRYMAPERFQGRGDVYALGLVLYELLTLRPAFDEADRARLVDRIVRGDPPPRPRQFDPRLPRDLEVAVLKAIEREPGHRYATAADVAADLRRWLNDLPLRARPVGPVGQLWRWCRRRPAVAGLLGAVAGLLVTVAAITSTSAVWLAAEKENALRNLDDAERARRDAKEQLGQSLLDQVRADRRGGVAGVRRRGLEALARAASLRRELDLPVSPRLRTELLAVLNTPDLADGPRWWHQGLGEPTAAACDSTFERFAVSLAARGLVVGRVPSGEVLHRLEDFPTGAEGLRFSPDGRWLGGRSRGAADEVRVWDLTAGKEVLRLAVGRPTLPRMLDECFDFTADGKRLAVATAERPGRGSPPVRSAAGRPAE